jgi:hypothetical protein
MKLSTVYCHNDFRKPEFEQGNFAITLKDNLKKKICEIMMTKNLTDDQLQRRM